MQCELDVVLMMARGSFSSNYAQRHKAQKKAWFLRREQKTFHSQKFNFIFVIKFIHFKKT